MIARVWVSLIIRTGGAERPFRQALQRGFQLPDRRVPRPADDIQREARPCPAAIAFHLEASPGRR
jgi:hypothetical protein